MDTLIETTMRMTIFNIISNFNATKDNNSIINAIIKVVLLSFTTYALNYIHSIFYYKKNIFYIYFSSFKDFSYFKDFYLFRKKNTIEYVGKTSTVCNIYDNTIIIANSYSDNFKALWQYITNSIITNQSIYEIKEIYSCNGPKKNQDWDTFYIVSQSSSFLIDKNLEIYAYSNLQQEEVEENEKKKNNKIEKMIITLYSYKSSLSEIMEFVKKITDKYILDISTVRNGKKFIYEIVKTKYEENSYECWNEGIFESNRTFNNFFFDNKKEVLQKIYFFLNNKEWYNEKGIPYTLGIGLHGPPGTGKSSFIKALANETGRHIICFSFKNIKTKNQLNSIFFEDTYNSDNKKRSIGFDKKIIAFEDIDCIGDIILKREKNINYNYKTRNSKRKNKNISANQVTNFIEQLVNLDTNEQKDIIKMSSEPQPQEEPITLDDILNLWDGLRETPGRIIVISSNHYDKLDPALTRPGRIDISLPLTNASHHTISEIYYNLFKMPIDTKKLHKIKSHFYSPAEIINIYLDENTDPNKMMKRLMENRRRD